MIYLPLYEILYKNLGSKCLSFKKIFRLKYNWHTILYQFRVYNIVVQHLHTLWIDHHHKCSNHLLPKYYDITDYIPYAVHYIPEIYLFYNWKFVSLKFPSPI